MVTEFLRKKKYRSLGMLYRLGKTAADVTAADVVADTNI